MPELLDTKANSTPALQRGKYEDLFDDVEAELEGTTDTKLANVALERVEVKVKDPSLEKAFAPILKADKPVLEDYAYLMEKDEDIYQASMPGVLARDIAMEPVVAARRNYDKYVTDQAAEESKLRLFDVFKRDLGFAHIMKQAGFTEPTFEAVKAIREDPELRYALGAHLLDQLDSMIATAPTRFGDQLIANRQKQNRAAEGMGPHIMKSREYAVYLALAKLGGSFSRPIEGQDLGRRSHTGMVLNGQHRQAADVLLGLEETPYVVE